MAGWERLCLHVLTVGVSTTGLIYYWMKYLLESDDPFSVLNHPWQAGMLEVHLVLSPLLVFLVGMIARSHIAKKMNSGNRSGRRSGLLSLFSFPVMVISGYLLQVASDPTILIWLSNLHLLSGGLFFSIYLVHQAISWWLAIKGRTDKFQEERVRIAA